MRLFLVSVLIIFSCNSSCSQAKKKEITYQNIVILSDFSSRVNNLPIKDFEEIKKLLEYFRNECVKPGQKIGDKSCISFSSFSDNKMISIDNSTIINIGERQRFINSTGEYSKKGLDQQIYNFEIAVRNKYRNSNNPGLDLISILIDKIEKKDFLKRDTILSDGTNTTKIKYKNQIHVFTDGYLEYRSNGNKQFYFGEKEINRIRTYCMQNNCDVLSALKRNNSLGLPAYKIVKQNELALYVHETHERDKDIKYQTYENPLGLRDNEILEAVWRKWAIESGFKSFEWSKY
jgi:hypothetical protein